jgi:hypothetical protein
MCWPLAVGVEITLGEPFKTGVRGSGVKLGLAEHNPELGLVVIA